MIVGGDVVAFHGHRRVTKDIEVFYEGSSTNVSCWYGAVMEFDFYGH